MIQQHSETRSASLCQYNLICPNSNFCHISAVKQLARITIRLVLLLITVLHNDMICPDNCLLVRKRVVLLVFVITHSARRRKAFSSNNINTGNDKKSFELKKVQKNSNSFA